MESHNYFLFSFGEIEISGAIVAFIIVLTLFTFLAVGISSFKLVQAAVDDDDDDDET